MNSNIKRFLTVVATSLLMVSLSPAEESGGSVSTPISSTTLSGYVLSYIGGNNTDVPPAYLQWLIGKRQAALNAFNQEYASTHGYWGNTFLLQARLSNYHLTWVSGQTPVPIAPVIVSFFYFSEGAYFDNSGYAYFDPPSLMAGPGGTYLMPDLRLVRMQAKGFGIPKR